MKKTIVIVILVVYIASIAVVNFFGLQIKQFDGVDYVEQIKCDTVTVLNETPVTVLPFIPEPNEAGIAIPEFYFDFIPGTYTTDPSNMASNPNRVRLDYEVLPHTADDSKVGFVFQNVVDANGNLLVGFDESTQTFVFLQSFEMIEVTLKSTDGRGIKTTVRIMGVE